MFLSLAEWKNTRRLIFLDDDFAYPVTRYVLPVARLIFVSLVIQKRSGEPPGGVIVADHPISLPIVLYERVGALPTAAHEVQPLVLVEKFEFPMRLDEAKPVLV